MQLLCGHLAQRNRRLLQLLTGLLLLLQPAPLMQLLHELLVQLVHLQLPFQHRLLRWRQALFLLQLQRVPQPLLEWQQALSRLLLQLQQQVVLVIAALQQAQLLVLRLLGLLLL
jgi:hypothetical protein